MNRMWKYTMEDDIVSSTYISSNLVQSSTVITTSAEHSTNHNGIETSEIESTTSNLVIDNDNISNTTVIDGIDILMYSY